MEYQDPYCDGTAGYVSEADFENINRELQTAEKLMKLTNANLFLTGRAGTGKTTFLRNLLQESTKRAVVLAPTGVAAINAGGVTIHSFFQLPFHPFIPGVGFADGNHNKFTSHKRRLIRSLELIVIDEISMVRPDTLDAIDDVLRRVRRNDMPFGGTQLLLIGDLRQLAPVVKDDERNLLAAHYHSPYFFESIALRKAGFYTIELKTIYRQNDRKFIEILNAVRDGIISESQLRMLNSRYNPGNIRESNPGCIRLTTHNQTAFGINATNLDRLPGKSRIYRCKTIGNFPASSYPADAELLLKPGAQVMFLKNDPGADRRFYNGLLGRVKYLDEDKVTVSPVDGSPDIIVGPIEWQNIRYEADPQTNEIKEIIDGSFSQIPLRTAWAITIHKSQGLTFDNCIVDASRSFAPGQAYVALSRCRTFEGLRLDSPLSPAALICDPHINSFLKAATSCVPDNAAIEALCRAAQYNSLVQLFDFSSIRSDGALTLHTAEEYFASLYPSTVASFAASLANVTDEVINVAVKFCNQYAAALSANDSETIKAMMPRIKAGCSYFLRKIDPIEHSCRNLPREHDSKEKQKRIRKNIDQLLESIEIKKRLLRAFASRDFSTSLFSDIKCKVYNEIEKGSKADALNRKTKNTPAYTTEDAGGDIPNPRLYRIISDWRRKLAEDTDKPAYTILSNKTIIQICRELPRDVKAFGKIKGIGNSKRILYGQKICSMVNEYISGEQS